MMKKFKHNLSIFSKRIIDVATEVTLFSCQAYFGKRRALLNDSTEKNIREQSRGTMCCGQSK